MREISSRLRENDTRAVEDLRLRAGELARREFLTNIAHELRTLLMAADGDVILCLEREGTEVLLSTEDHGIGIEQQRQSHIFDRFSHLEKDGDNLFSGVGVGLAIARQVIEQHHGKWEVHNLDGEGSTFTIRLAAMRVAS